MSDDPKAGASAPPEPARQTATAFESVVLVLQGGGALGAYQAGVYQALVEHDVEPTWISGISIGAINSGIIAGNAPKDRVDKLRAFWELVSSSHPAWSWLQPVRETAERRFANQLAAGEVLVNGVKGFFSPRFPPPPLQPPGSSAAISWYDTAPLRSTLESLIDFDRINSRAMRFSVGAVDVCSGNFAYFDNAKEEIRPEHIMASGALPPAFAPVTIGSHCYWDGGLVSNTPLDWVLSAQSNLDTLVFQVDLWSARGQLPRDMAEVAVRMKEIQYSSRTRAATEAFRKSQRLRGMLNTLLAKLPAELAASAEAKGLANEARVAAYNIVELVYRSPTYEGDSKDYEFSRKTMEEHWRAGYHDAIKTLSHPQVLQRPKGSAKVNVFDFLRRATPAPAVSRTNGAAPSDRP